jgi:hypothetical protein
MAEPSRYCFFVHREQAPYRLVLRDGSAFPDDTNESECQLTRIREESDVNADVREEIAANGYCLLAIGLKLDAVRRSTSQPERSAMILESTITCPHCGNAAVETMPRDACQFFYDCKGCSVRLKPKAGDCCVFCSYGSVRCLPMQSGEHGCSEARD